MNPTLLQQTIASARATASGRNARSVANFGCPLLLLDVQSGYTAFRYRPVTTRWTNTNTGKPSRLHHLAGRENATTSL